MTPDGLEGTDDRIALAIVVTKLDQLSSDLHSWRAETREQMRQICQQIEQHDARLRDLERQHEAMKVRVGGWAGIQTALSAVLSAIAAWIGYRN